MKLRLILFFSLSFITFFASATAIINMTNYKRSITISGTVTANDFSYINACGNTSRGCDAGQLTQGPAATLISSNPNATMVYVARNYPTCDQHYDGVPTLWSTAKKNAFAAWVNSYLATNPVFYLYSGVPPDVSESVKPAAVFFRCISPVDGAKLHVQMYSASGEIINPPPKPSQCSFTTATINLNFSSNSLSINQIKTGSLNITCTTGDAVNYKVRLQPANNAISNDGKLAFGNGVVAQVSLNGKALYAGNSDSFVNLSSSSASTTLPVQVALSGTATSAGYSTAQGILILESY